MLGDQAVDCLHQSRTLKGRVRAYSQHDPRDVEGHHVRLAKAKKLCKEIKAQVKMSNTVRYF